MVQYIRELEGITSENITEDILNSSEPICLRGYVSAQPLVKEAKKSSADAVNYLRNHYSGEPLNACYIPEKEKGRVFYSENMDGFNFSSIQKSFLEISGELTDKEFQNNFSVYIGSTELSRCFPQIRTEFDVGRKLPPGLVNIWIGGKTRVAAHFDVAQNLACCMAGRRRFTLFPPSQGENLYPGPLDFAPGGVQISMVDFCNPDERVFPRFKEAIKHSMEVELEAGDALVLPSMWWHHVEGLDSVNVLVTHWWQETPRFLGRGADALLLSLLSLRDLPVEQRAAWKELFEYYVFDANPKDFSHIPEHARSFLEQPLSEFQARKIRSELQRNLRR